MDTRRWLNLFGIGMLIVLSAQGKIFIVATLHVLLVYSCTLTHDTTPTTMAKRCLQAPGYDWWWSNEVDVVCYSNIGQGGVVPKHHGGYITPIKSSYALLINPLKVSAIFARVDRPTLWRRDGSHDTIMVMTNGSILQVNKNSNDCGY